MPDNNPNQGYSHERLMREHPEVVQGQSYDQEQGHAPSWRDGRLPAADQGTHRITGGSYPRGVKR